MEYAMMREMRLFFKKCLLCLCIILFQIILCGCNPFAGKPEEFYGKALEGNELLHVEISYEAGDDSAFGGPEAKYIILCISNISSEPVRNVVITINDTYKARLSELYYYFKTEKTYKKYGSNHLPANISLTFDFSHDVPNHFVVRDEKKSILPVSELIYHITLESDQKFGKWEFIKTAVTS